MFLSVPPAVAFAQSVDRQLSVKPDGTKFSHAHAHHPSAGSRGIGAFLGTSMSRRCTGGGPGSCSRCVQMHHFQAPESPPEVVASSLLACGLPAHVLVPTAACPEDTSHIIQAGSGPSRRKSGASSL